MAGPRGYNSYHGKISKGKIALAVLLVLVIIGALAVIRLQKYVVYDDSGRPYLDLPQFSQSAGSSADPSSDGAGDANLTIEEPTHSAVQAVQLSVGAMTQWQETWTAASAGGTYNAAVYTVKDEDGFVYLDNQFSPVSAVKTVEGAGTAIGDMLKDDGVYTVAKIACFRDSVASSADLEGMGLKNTGGYIFYDGDNKRWLDPEKSAARQYLVDLAAACAAMGFDEILLTDVSYPTVGKLDKIDYGPAATALPDSLRETLTAFLKQMHTALAQYDVKLSIQLPASLFAGGDGDGGQSLADMVPLVDRVYADADEDQSVFMLIEEALSASGDADYVPVLGSLDAVSSDSYLIAP